MTVSVSIMAHPQRADMVERLVKTLGIDDSRVAWDQKNDRWDTGMRAWGMYDPKASHHLVIQDDGHPAENLLEVLNDSINTFADETATSLYLGRVRPYAQKVTELVNAAQAMDVSPGWIGMDSLFWGVAIMLPTRLIDGAMRWGYLNRDTPYYDQRIARYLARSCSVNTVYYTWPSLVDHDPGPTLIPGHGENRVAHSWLEDARDWTANGPVMRVRRR